MHFARYFSNDCNYRYRRPSITICPKKAAFHMVMWTVADPENFGGGDLKHKTSKIRMSSPKLRLIFRRIRYV